MSDAANAVLTETRGRVLLITLNRPEAMNAINTDLAQGLLRAVDSGSQPVGVRRAADFTWERAVQSHVELYKELVE